jgi:hypothetical protein
MRSQFVSLFIEQLFEKRHLAGSQGTFKLLTRESVYLYEYHTGLLPATGIMRQLEQPYKPFTSTEKIPELPV